MIIKENKYRMLTTNEIEAQGWLLEQLKIQAAGLSGNLHKVWPDVKDSQWIGGDREGWERVPYWLDGFIPLAYLLKDEKLIADAKMYIDYIIEKQIESDNPATNGWICPFKDDDELLHFDEWAVFLICKALIVYYECSGDERIQDVIYKILKQLSWRLEHYQIKSWGSYRWYEALISIYWLYDRVKEDWLIEFAHLLYEQGADYNKQLKYWREQIPHGGWRLRTHVVNLAMALKSDALMSKLLNAEGESIDPDEFAEDMLQKLFEYHGTVVGHFNGDECISGTSPVHGTELCGVVEAMYSYEWLFAITGKPKWADRLEMLAYNALPAGLSDDMWVRQYDQMVNQIACPQYKDKSPFMTNGIDGGMFGLEPNYGCCTANFHQGWPKFALSTFMRSENGLACGAIAPAKATLVINGANVECTLDTMYPFRNKLTYIIKTDKEVTFDFEIRIPSWVNKATVDGIDVTPGEMFNINRLWRGESKIEVVLDFKVEFVERPNDLFALKRGPFVYSLAIEEEWTKMEYTAEGVERKYPYCDYEVLPKSKWNYSYATPDIGKIEFIENDNYDIPFSSKNPPIYAYAEAFEINWGFKEGFENFTCREVPLDRTPISEVKKVKLMPYGCPKLRMTEMPVKK